MTMTTNNLEIVINTDQPIFLVDVEDNLDNQHWKFCADDPMSETSTYEELSLHPDREIPAGTVVKIEGLWGFLDGGGLTPTFDFKVTLPKDSKMSKVVPILLSKYHIHMQRNHAIGRFFFIEQFELDADGAVNVIWGT